MGTRGTKRTRGKDVNVAYMDSGVGFCNSVQSDASSAPPSKDDVNVAARALTAVSATSPEGVRSFVRRLTPATVVCSLDLELVRSGEPQQMAEGKIRWAEEELRLFLEACLEEMTARAITSNNPKLQGYTNLQMEMKERAGRELNKGQVRYMWEQCRKRWTMWTWLESKATGHHPVTQAIVASDEWWESMDKKKLGVRVFKNAPLKHIDLHCAVFRGRTVVGNHSAVAGATPATTQQTALLPNINIAELVAQQQNTATLGGSSGRKGKRPAADNGTLGGSVSKKTRSDSTGEALHRLADLKVESMESRTKREEEERARGAAVCMELVLSDGHLPGSQVWFRALDVFESAYWRKWFIEYCLTPEERLQYIQVTWERQFGAGAAGGQGGGQPGYGRGAGQQAYCGGAPPPTCSGG